MTTQDYINAGIPTPERVNDSIHRHVCELQRIDKLAKTLANWIYARSHGYRISWDSADERADCDYISPLPGPPDLDITAEWLEFARIEPNDALRHLEDQTMCQFGLIGSLDLDVDDFAELLEGDLP